MTDKLLRREYDAADEASAHPRVRAKTLCPDILNGLVGGQQQSPPAAAASVAHSLPLSRLSGLGTKNVSK
jgi:hypothetical protein